LKNSAFNLYNHNLSFFCVAFSIPSEIEHRSVQNLLSSNLLCKNIRLKVHRTVILPVVSCGCETWSLTLREGHRVRVFENRVQRKIFGPQRDEVMGRGVKKTTQREASLSVFFAKYYLGDQIKKNEIGRACGTYGEQERYMQGFGGEAWTALLWLRRGTGGGCL
jgi:hypothetical protein